MNKINKVVINSVAVVAALVGALNVIDYIYASNAANAADQSLTMSATINSSATVSIDIASASLDVTPGAGTTGGTEGSFGKSEDVTITTYANVANSCNIKMAPVEKVTSESDTTALTYIDTTETPNVTYRILSLPGTNGTTTYTESTFVNDRWGYRVNNSDNYNPIASADNSIISNTGSSSGTATTINFATKLTQATRPGNYSRTVSFSVTCPTT